MKSRTKKHDLKLIVQPIKDDIQECTEQVRLNPKSERAYTRRSYAYMRLADVYVRFDDRELADENLLLALDDCDKLLELSTGDSSVHINHGLIKEKMANVKVDNGDVEGATFLLKEAIQSHTKAIELEGEVASTYYIRGNVRQSLAYLERKLSNVKSAEELTESGIDDYNIAVKLKDRNAYASRAAARILLALHRRRNNSTHDATDLIEKAISDYDQAINYEVDKPKLFYLRAEARAMLAELRHKDSRLNDLSGLIKLAIADYTQELEDDPQFFYAFVGIASVMYLSADAEFCRGNFTDAKDIIKDAEVACKNALKLAPRSVSALYESAYLTFLGAAIAEKEQDMPRACKLLKATISSWDKAIKLDPNSHNLKDRRHSAQAALDELQEEIGQSKALNASTSQGDKDAKTTKKTGKVSIDELRKSLEIDDPKTFH
ncbi:MAG: hypothetical protein K0U41_07290 [Gammaproteobacteria bacterium]|nr:hypothetical protein [Gammaproteobacteria bacterium]